MCSKTAWSCSSSAPAKCISAERGANIHKLRQRAFASPRLPAGPGDAARQQGIPVDKPGLKAGFFPGRV